MTAESRVGEIETRLADATPGPWLIGAGEDIWQDDRDDADAALISAAPEDLRWCLDRITEAQTVIRDAYEHDGAECPDCKDALAAWLESVSTGTERDD